MVDSTSSTAPDAGERVGSRRAVWKARMSSALKVIGVSSIIGAIGGWNTICGVIDKLRPSFDARLAAGLSAQPELRSERLLALLADVSKPKNAKVATPKLMAFLRTRRARAGRTPCDGSGNSALPSDMQAAVTLLVAAAFATDSPLTLDSLILSGVGIRGKQLRRPSFAGSCLVASVFDSSAVYAGDFRGADLTRSSFRYASLDSSDMRTAQLDSAKFVGSSLVGVDLSEVHAPGVSFFSASMPCALLGNADLAGANFSLARLPWAYFGGADVGLALNLLEAKDLRFAVLDGAIGLSTSASKKLGELGARVGVVSDAEYAPGRKTQFHQDSICHITLSTARPL